MKKGWLVLTLGLAACASAGPSEPEANELAVAAAGTAAGQAGCPMAQGGADLSHADVMDVAANVMTLDD